MLDVDRKKYREGTERAQKCRAIPENGGLTLSQWRLIQELFGGRCAYCKEIKSPLSIDHVISFSRGGLHIWQNVVPACRSCNSKKGGSERTGSRGRLAERMINLISLPDSWLDKLG